MKRGSFLIFLFFGNTLYCLDLSLISLEIKSLMYSESVMPDKFAYFSIWFFISSFILSFIFSVFGSDVVLIESSLYVGR